MVADLLIDAGKSLFQAPRTFVEFTQVREADELLNDLDRHPHAFVIGCLMDRQIRAELAWLIPHHFAQKLGDFQFSTLSSLTLGQIKRLMTEPAPLHRFPEEMSKNLHAGVAVIGGKYAGNAANIWENKPPSAEVVCRFLELRGIGPKIASMAANILVRHFKTQLGDYYCIDISADVHVRRVFRRLGLIRVDASIDEVIYRARALHPEFPGLMDFPAWEIGRNWCGPRKRLCHECYMKRVCPTAKTGDDPGDG